MKYRLFKHILKTKKPGYRFTWQGLTYEVIDDITIYHKDSDTIYIKDFDF
jgi:hypothetical protein